MNIVITLITIFAISIFSLSFVRYKLAVMLYISYIILVPYMDFKIAGLSLSYYWVNIVLLCAFIFNFKIKNKISPDFGAIKPFLFLFASLLFISFFADWPSPEFQLNQWKVDFMQTCILSFIIWNVSINDEKFVTYAKWSLIISILIAGIYAVLIMGLDGLNPYASFLSLYFNQEIDYAEKFGDSVRIRNQGTMYHPFAWVYYLSAFCPFFLTLFLKEKKKKIFYIFLLCFIVFNIVIADVRTGIVSTVVALTYIYVRYNKINFKTIFYGIAIVFVLSLITMGNKELSERFLSLVDVSGTKSDVEGSSYQMRIDQFEGCFNEISHSPIFGKGYAWTTYYMSKNISHPVLLAFESLIFVVICNHGIAGIIIWSIFAIMLFRAPRKILSIKKNVYLVDGVTIFFFTYSIATGLYGYLAPFAMFYSYLLGYLYMQEQKDEENEKEIDLL